MAVGLAFRPGSFVTPFLFFYFPVLFAIWYGGFWPGVTASVLSAVLTNYFLLLPPNQFLFDLSSLLRCTFFTAAFIVTAWLVESRRRAAEAELASQMDALRASEERLSGIISSAMDAIITVDDRQQVVVFNHAAERVFGHSATEAIGKPLDRLLPERFRETHRHHITEFAATGITSRTVKTQTTLSGLRSSGEEFPIEATISQADAGGQKLYTVILRDMTQRLQTEQALVQSEKLAMVGRLAATVAHEVNNPLSTVSDLIHLIKNDPTATASVQARADIAEAEINRAANIVKHTLGFSRGGASRTRFRLTEVLDSVLSLASRKHEQKGVICEKQYLSDAEIVGVASEIQQVLWNLLTNVIEAVQQNGRISLRVRFGHKSLDPAAEGVFVTIADNGGGIDREHLSRIGEPFYTTKPTGNGLGLWVSKQIIDNHKGEMRVRSRTSCWSAGTVFSIFIPSDSPIAQTEQRGDESGRAHRRSA